MKKTFSKIVACLFVIGVLFVSTPFLINTRADSVEGYYYIGKYQETIPGQFENYDFKLNCYFNYSENKMKVDFYVLTTDQYIGDYLSYYLYVTKSYPNYGYNEHMLATSLGYTSVGYGTTVQELTDSLLISYEFNCDLTSCYLCQIVYRNEEDETNINLSKNIVLGYGPMMYDQIIEDTEIVFYQKGQTDTIDNTNPTSIISRFGEGVGSILSIPIFGQLTLGTLVFIPLSMAVLLLLLKIWRRN